MFVWMRTIYLMFLDQFLHIFAMTDTNKKGGGSSSRLDRLLKLLDSGSTPLSRAQAAEQIGELVLQSCTSSSSNNGEGNPIVNVNAVSVYATVE